MKIGSSFVLSTLFGAINGAVSQDGIWTGHDWSDTVDEIKDVDGVLSALNDIMSQRMNSAKTY